VIKLIIEDDEGKTTVVPLIRDEITIGRKEGNTIRLTERNVSRRHAKLLKKNGAIFIEDQESYNGIKVNGNKIDGRVAITEGDRIQIGDYVLGLKLAAGASAEDPFSSAKTMEIQQSLDDQPTTQIDVRETQEAGADRPQEEGAATLDKAECGRLVCVTSNFAGEEWLLDKPVMVVGRTEENDININHRSISRHHARITFENNRHTILDLQSANGVRINGEEYGKVELRPGDMIDLGHVRLRFVAAGEDFVFSRDATVVDISQPAAPKRIIWVAAAIIAVAIIGGLIYYFMDSADTSLPKPTPPKPGVAMTAEDSGPAATADTKASSVAADSELTQAIARINQDLSSEQWDSALASCQKLTPEQQAKVKEACQRAVQEKEAQVLFEKFHSAATRNAFLEAVRYQNQIPSTSVYKNKNLQMLADAKTKYLAQAYKELDEQIKKGKCIKAGAIADQIQEVDPSDNTVTNKVKNCTAGDVVAVKVPPKPRPPRPRPPRPRPPKPKPPKPKPAGPTLADLERAKKIVHQASQSYVAGNHARAIQLAKQALKLAGGQKMAIQIIGASSCYLKKARDAKWAYNRLPPQQRNLLKKVCQKNGVNLD